ncbi:MAG: hypothetical protein HRU38_22935 [Saccharospirillaceae bacterium]|nr:hypothetical protein [Pseudomonadales bacterium]NRB81480.1 hypothetical protein [Saccharospirillaceae bacterium]
MLNIKIVIKSVVLIFVLLLTQSVNANVQKTDTNTSTSINPNTSTEYDGKSLALEYCSQCHFLPAINRLNAQQWPVTIDRMINKIEKLPQTSKIKLPTSEEVEAIKRFINSKLSNATSK